MAARLEFQHLAQKHEGDDNRGGLEIYGDTATWAPERVGEDARYKHRHQAIEVRDAGADGDQREHVEVARDQRGYASGQDRLPKTVRFCETDLMTVHKDSFQVQRLEVVNTGRRRRWSVAEKLRIVEESFQGHRQVSATACRHDISPSLLFSWRKAFRRGRDEVIGFAPALIVPDEEAPLGAAAAVGRMEIVTVTGQRIMVGADVDVLALARVVAALEAR